MRERVREQDRASHHREPRDQAAHTRAKTARDERRADDEVRGEQDLDGNQDHLLMIAQAPLLRSGGRRVAPKLGMRVGAAAGRAVS